MLTGWYKVDGEWNWSDGSGAWHANEWRHDGFGWWYSWADGTYPTSSWQLIGGKWYLFDGSGYMLSGWQEAGGTWYYLNPGGDMVVGWLNLGGTWYYLKDSGAMATGWQLFQGDWYYLDQSGAMESDWLYLLGDWYYLASDGAMRTGWKSIAGTWYYFEPSGVMATGWKDIDGARYYLSGSGAMATGTRTICGLTHRFSSSGAWIEMAGGGTPVEVKVVDKIVHGDTYGNVTLVTKYEYDDAGKLICSNTLYSRSIDPRSDGRYSYIPSRIVQKDIFGYEGSQVVRVSHLLDPYAYYGASPDAAMIDSGYDSFAYDGKGLCVSHGYERHSQGYDYGTYEYDVDETGQVESAVLTRGPISEMYRFDWSYLESGIMESVTARGAVPWYIERRKIRLDSSLSSAEKGRYVYEWHPNLQAETDKAVMRFDDEGNLIKVGETSLRYKTLLVNADSYVPSIFSNPQDGFQIYSEIDPYWRKPSLTTTDIDRILGK